MKHDWNRLKTAYMNGRYKSLAEFAEKKNLSYKTLQHYAIGWTKEKKAKDAEKAAKIEEAVREKQIESEATRQFTRNNRILHATDKFLDVYDNVSKEDIATLITKSPKAFVSLTAGLVNLQRVHRTAEGLDKNPNSEAIDEARRVLVEFVEAKENGDE